MITHDQLIYAIEHETPLRHGKDFTVMHPLDEVTKLQNGDPFFAVWNSQAPKPSVPAMIAIFEKKYQKGFADMMARETRDYYLAKCDWTQHADVPTETTEKWKAYRQALRDMTTQPGYPLTIDWPVPPT